MNPEILKVDLMINQFYFVGLGTSTVQSATADSSVLSRFLCTLLFFCLLEASVKSNCVKPTGSGLFSTGFSAAD